MGEIQGKKKNTANEQRQRHFPQTLGEEAFPGQIRAEWFKRQICEQRTFVQAPWPKEPERVRLEIQEQGIQWRRKAKEVSGDSSARQACGPAHPERRVAVSSRDVCEKKKTETKKSPATALSNAPAACHMWLLRALEIDKDQKRCVKCKNTLWMLTT